MLENRRMSYQYFNPMEFVVEAMTSHEMPMQHLSPVEIVTELQGHWGSYKMQFLWQEEIHVLHLNVLLELPINATPLGQLHELMMILNERLILGHFEVFPEENMPAFRYSIVALNTTTISSELIEEIIDIILDECESCFPAFKSLIEDDKEPSQAALMAVMDTMGEA